MSGRNKIIIILAAVLVVVLIASGLRSLSTQQTPNERSLSEAQLLAAILQIDPKANGTFKISSSEKYPNGFYLVTGKTDYRSRIEYLVIDQYPKYPKPFAFNPWDKSAYPADLPEIPKALQDTLTSLYPDTEWE